MTQGDQVEQETWTRWADEGGLQVRFTQLSNGGIKVAIVNGEIVTEATLANFRVAQLPDWMQPKLNTQAQRLREMARELAPVKMGLASPDLPA